MVSMDETEEKDSGGTFRNIFDLYCCQRLYLFLKTVRLYRRIHIDKSRKEPQSREKAFSYMISVHSAETYSS